MTTLGEPVVSMGLSTAEVQRRVDAGQVNVQPPRAGRTVAQIVGDNVFTRINFILAALLAVVISTGSLKNGLFGLLIVANSIVGIIQEVRAKRTLDRLSVIGEAQPKVRRGGKTVTIPQSEVVLDDIIELAPGDQVIVDGVAVADRALAVDESLLTGENDPVTKHAGDAVLSGSFVASGSGAYRATAVGADAYAAKLAAEASRFTLVHSELRNGIDKILGYVTYLLVPVGVLTIWTQLREADTGMRSALLRMVAALVPMVPEGLVLMTSVAFAVGVIRLGRMKCLVQELPAIEALARVDSVCVDKTGTLTEGGMTGERLVGTGTDEAEIREALAQLLATDPYPNATNQAVSALVGRPDHPWDVTETAPFSSATKWSGATFTDRFSVLLGAPDVLAPEGDPLRTQAQEIGAEGLRVVMVSRSDLPVNDPNVIEHSRPLALVVVKQRVRADAADTVAYFDQQQVGIWVISGDNALSVGTVAHAVGIPGEAREAVDARVLPTDKSELTEVLRSHHVYGRVTPQQKRTMVQTLQASGRSCAMIGDGVNDVLSLKDADVGVAMGSGSDASRSAAQIVLLDDRFATLPHVVAEGRRVIGNIERVATLFLTKTFYSVLLALLVGLFGMKFPFVPIHVTITAWFTIGIPAFILALAPNAERAKPGFTGRVLARSAPGGLVIGLAAFISYWGLTRTDRESTDEQISTAVLIVVIAIALWVLAVVSRPDRPWKVALIAVSALAYVVMFTVPPLADFFSLDVHSPTTLIAAAIAAACGIVACEFLWRMVMPRISAHALTAAQRETGPETIDQH